MSTYHYLACVDHRVTMSAPLVVVRMRGLDLDGRDEPARGAVTKFFARHPACQLRVLSEHDCDEWPRENPDGIDAG